MRQPMPENWNSQISQACLGQPWQCVVKFLNPYPVCSLSHFPLPHHSLNVNVKQRKEGHKWDESWNSVERSKGWQYSGQCTGTGSIRATCRTKHLLKVTQPVNEPILALRFSDSMLFLTNRRWLTKSEFLVTSDRD